VDVLLENKLAHESQASKVYLALALGVFCGLEMFKQEWFQKNISKQRVAS
jgi:hypothetical protein